jgi:antagonist of KipI
MSELLVISPGLLTTVQDLGRWGYQSSGVPVAGPMDPYAHRFANTLVGNAADAAALEITLAGPVLQCDDERLAAVAGAEFELMVDERPVPMHTAVALRPRARLAFGRRRRGARAYLALSGGIDVPRVLGSRATHLASTMGGHHGRMVRAGDRLPLGPAPSRPAHYGHPDTIETRVPAEAAAGQARLRILPSHKQEWFAADALDRLQESAYTIDARSDRMGFRLVGPPVARVSAAEMISDATVMGALQVPLSGEPILLMADRQTTGGYPTIATVISADLGVAGQLAPGDSVSFTVCSRAEAFSALIARERVLMAAARVERP